MNITQLTQEGLKVTLQVVIPANTMQEKRQEQLQKTAATGSMKGFRKGKISINTLERVMGVRVTAQIKDDQIREGLKHVFNNYKVYGTPEVNTPEVNEDNQLDKDFSFTISFEKAPEITLPDFAAINVTKPVLKFNEEDIANYLMQVRKALANARKREEQEIVMENDLIRLQISKIITDAGEISLDPAIIDNIYLLEEHVLFGKNKSELVGSTLNEEKTLAIEILEKIKDYNPKYQSLYPYIGQTVKLVIKITEAHEITLPSLDDEQLLKALQVGSNDNINEAVEKHLQKHMEPEVYTLLKMRLFHILENLLSYDVPTVILEQERENLKQHLQNQFADSNFDNEFVNKLALRRARIAMLLTHYADTKNLQATKEDIKTFILREVKNLPQELSIKVMNFYNTNKDAMQAVVNNIIEDKAVRGILDNEIKLDPQVVTVVEFEKSVEREGDLQQYQQAPKED